MRDTQGRGVGDSTWTPEEGGEEGKGKYTLDYLTKNAKDTVDESAYGLLREQDLEDMQALEATRMDFRFWKKKADDYNFGQGELVTTSRIVFPKLEHYTKCHDVVRDWTKCKTVNKWASWTGICGPLKEQVAMCINDTWVERYRFRAKMSENVWRKQDMLMSQTASQARYDRRFYGMMVDDHDTD